jgi:hypothetical protein
MDPEHFASLFLNTRDEIVLTADEKRATDPLSLWHSSKTEMRHTIRSSPARVLFSPEIHRHQEPYRF